MYGCDGSMATVCARVCLCRPAEAGATRSQRSAGRRQGGGPWACMSPFAEFLRARFRRARKRGRAEIPTTLRGSVRIIVRQVVTHVG